jgi:hypothetical protein
MGGSVFFVGTWFCSGLVCGFCFVLLNACVGSYGVLVLLAFSVVRSKRVLHIAVFFYLGQNSQRPKRTGQYDIQNTVLPGNRTDQQN